MDGAIGIGVAARNLSSSIDVFRLSRGSASYRHIKAAALLVRTHKSVLERRRDRRIPAADKISPGIDTEQVRISRARVIELRKGPSFPEESVNDQGVTVGIQQVPLTNDRAGFVDPPGVGVIGAREVQPGHGAVFAEKKTVGEPGIVDVGADHVSTVIGFEGFTQRRAQDRTRGDRDVLTMPDQQSVPRGDRPVRADNFAVIVDAATGR